MDARGGSEKKLSGLRAALFRLNKKRVHLEKHLTEGTLPKVIFGTRALFIARAKGKVDKEAWNDARNGQFYSMGQTSAGGNANVRLNLQSNSMGINFPHQREAKVTRRWVIRVESERRWLGLRVPEKYRPRLNTMLASGVAYSVCVIKRERRYFAEVSFAIHNPTMREAPAKIISVDSNPEGFAATVVSKDGNMLAHKFFRDDRLVHASEKKRKSVMGRLVGEIFSYATEREASAVVLENLRISGSRRFGTKANRLIYSFVRKKFFNNVLTRGWKQGLPVFTVSPAYTSKVGDVKYKEMYGLSIHEAAALCIGRRFYGHGERLEEPMPVIMKRSRKKERVPVRYLWPSIYGYQRPSNPYMEPPGRKGSREVRVDGGNEAVLTGRPASEMTPLSASDEGVRKGGECGESPQATGNGGEPALPSPDGGGKVIATSSARPTEPMICKQPPLVFVDEMPRSLTALTSHIRIRKLDQTHNEQGDHGRAEKL